MNQSYNIIHGWYSEILCWTKEARYKKVHTVWLHLNEVQEQAEQTNDDRSQNSVFLCRGTDWKGAFGKLLKCWKCSMS